MPFLDPQCLEPGSALFSEPYLKSIGSHSDVSAKTSSFSPSFFISSEFLSLMELSPSHLLVDVLGHLF